MEILTSGKVLRMAIAGAIGGLIVFLILNPSIASEEMMQAQAQVRHAPVAGDPASQAIMHMMLLGIVIGAAIGAVLILAEEIESPRALRLLRLLGMGLIAGALFGSIGAGLAQVTFTILLSANVIIARTIGWALMGIAAGVPMGVAHLSVKRAGQGALGGLIGGAIGGILFDVVSIISFVTGNASVSRFIGFVIMGAAIGAAVGLVEEFAKEFWVTVLTGSKEGKSFILSKGETSIGRSEMVDIPLFGDSSVEKNHAQLVLNNNTASLMPSPGLAVTVNSQPTTNAALNSGDIIGIGKHRLRFFSKQVSYSSPQQQNYQNTAQPPQYSTPQTPLYGQPMQVSVPQTVTRLEAVSGPHTGQSFMLATNPIVLGREPGCNVVLINDNMASRRHAQLVFDSSSWRIEDMGSTNGIFVNGLRVTNQIINVGDQIGIGQTILRAC